MFTSLFKIFRLFYLNGWVSFQADAFVGSEACAWGRRRYVLAVGVKDAFDAAAAGLVIENLADIGGHVDFGAVAFQKVRPAMDFDVAL